MDEVNRNQEDPPEPSRYYEEATGYNLSYGSYVLSPVWVRRAVQNATGFDRLLLEYNFSFLPYFGLVFWVLFLFTQR